MKVTVWFAAAAALASCGAASSSETREPDETVTRPTAAVSSCRPGQFRMTIGATARCLRLGAPGAAVARSAQPGCSETEARKGFVRLVWRPATRQALGQRVAVTVRRDGFETGRYALGRELTPTRRSVVWTRLQGQAVHFWVVVTRTRSGWAASEPAEFDGPLCVADMP